MTRGVCRRLAELTALATVGLIALAGWVPTPASAQPQPAAKPPVVLFAVPGMVWQDVLGMPHVRALAATSSVAELSVKTRSSITRCATGLITVSAGNRTSGPPPVCFLDLTTWPTLRADNLNSRYNARVGALGSTLQAAGIKTVSVGSLPAPMIANAQGRVSDEVATLGQALHIGGVIALLDARLYNVLPTQRAAAARAIDDRIAGVEAALPPGATFIVAGVSDASAGGARLHTFIINGPGWTHNELHSSAAGRAPYVQLIDLAPTILTIEGVKVPTFMVGRPMQLSGAKVPPISAFVDDNRHAVLQRTFGQRVFLTVGIAFIVMMLLAAAPMRRGHQIALWLARLIAPAPMLIFLANGFPWWRWGRPAYGGIVLAGCIIIAGITTVVARRYGPLAIIVPPLLSFVVLCADQFTGARLQLSAPLGDSPLVAGRFSGMGNLDFSVMATSALVLAAALAAPLKRYAAIAVAGAIMAIAVVVDGAPQLGNDIGGVLSLLPAALVLVALVAGFRVTKMRALAVGVTTIVVAVGVAVADYSRPATEQTDVGRFVGQVLHGGAGTEIRRKFDASMATFGLTIGTFVVGFAIVIGYLARHRIRAALDSRPGYRSGAIAVMVVAVLGVFLNDSGVVIAAMATIVAVSAYYGGGLKARRPAARSSADPSG